MNKKDLLFSITDKDFDVQTFRCGGKGGQNVNKRDTGVRVVHKASGAEGRSCDERFQHQNKKIAFRRCVESKEFQSWLKLESAAKLQGYRDAEQKVEEMMKEENLKVEYYDLDE
jgi:protein subunit release factor B